MNNKRADIGPGLLIGIIIITVTFFVVLGIASKGFTNFEDVPKNLANMVNIEFGDKPVDEQAVVDLKKNIESYWNLNKNKAEENRLPQRHDFKKARVGDLQIIDLIPDSGEFNVRKIDVRTNPECVMISLTNTPTEQIVWLNEC